MSSLENPYQAPKVLEASYHPFQEATGGVWRKDRLLVMHKAAILPPRCVKSNVPTKRTLKRNLSWHHPAIFIALFVAWLVYIILALALSKKATIYIGLSDVWFAKRRRAIAVSWLMVLASIGLFVGGFATIDRNDAVAAIMFVTSVTLFFVSAVYGLLAARMVAPTRMTDDYVWIKGVHPDYLDQLPVWPYHP